MAAYLGKVQTVVFVVWCLLTSEARGHIVHPPSFEEYAVKETFYGPPAKVNLQTPQARNYRTVLRNGAGQGPNFADHYTVVTWGCGTECQMIGIVNAKTGKTYIAPMISNLGVEFRRDSRLLIINPPRAIQEAIQATEGMPNDRYKQMESFYFTWNGRTLTLVFPTALRRKLEKVG